MNYKYIYEYSEPEKKGETGVYRAQSCKKNQGELYSISNRSKATTIYEMLQYSIKTYSQKNSLGYRDIEDIIQEDKQLERKVDGKIETYTKTWTYYKLSEYKWISFQKLGEILNHLSSGLDTLGFKPKDIVSFYAPSSHHWLLLSYACFYRSLTVATIYDTLGADGLLHGLNETESTTLFISSEQINTLKKIHSKSNTLKTIIYTGEEPKNLEKDFPNLTFISIDELIKLGKEKPIDPVPPSKDDIAVIMYTSGSTGNPKGATLKHTNLIAALAGVEQLAEKVIHDEDRFISFLPLAHILAFILTTFCVDTGKEVGFASPRTLMDQAVRGCRGDLIELKPTVLPGVPQVFDSIRKGILNKVNASGEIMKNVFGYSLAIKGLCRTWGVPSWWIDELVFKKLREAVGGQLRLGLCGGAPLSDDLRLFFNDSVAEVLQGYGMTELCGLGSIVTEDNEGGTVGGISPALEFKLVDVPEGGYFSTENKGEIWIRGPCVTEGYFKNEKVTLETITEDGWLQTGDIGAINEIGQLSIIDRKKNLVKLSNGEYIALEKLESIYRNSIYVQNICITADSHHSKPIALIMPNLAALKHHATSTNAQSIEDFEDVEDNEAITKEVYRSCIEEGKKAGLVNAELVSGIYLTPLEWTVENGLLTGAQKIKRRELQEKFKDQLKALYNKQ